MTVRGDREKERMRYANAKDRADKQEAGGGSMAFKLPKDTAIFKFEKAQLYKVRILPFKVSDRDIDHRFADPGFYTFEYSYWMHGGLGLDGKGRHSCLQETFHKPCPVCEYLATLDRWGTDKDLHGKYRAKQRQLFALLDTESKEKGIQIYESSFFSGAGQMSLGQWIDNMVKANPDKYAGFYHLQDGMNLHLAVKQGKPFMGAPTWNISHVEGVEAKDLDEEILDLVPVLDELPIELSYDDLDEAFRQKGTKEKESEEKPSRASVSVTKNGDDENGKEDEDKPSRKWGDKSAKDVIQNSIQAGDNVKWEDAKFLVKRIASDGTLVLQDEDGLITKDVDPDEVVPFSEKPGKKPPKEEEVDEPDEEEEPEEEAPAKKPAKKK